MANHFKDKVVLITGASSGIGAALAKAFAKQGAKLALLARRQAKLEALIKELQPCQAMAIVCDVTQDKALSHAVAQAEQTLGSLDVVIANAGFGVVDYVEKLNLSDFHRQFETNVYGVLRTIYATLDNLKKTKGRLVLIGSAAGYMSMPQYGAYTMSKHAITALAQTLFAELKPYGISVTLITPGLIKTEIRNINNFGQYEAGTRDPLPDWLRLDADKAASIMIKAIQKRQREKIITLNAKLGIWLNRLFPGLLPWFFQRKILRKFSAKR
ncbi:MAG: SDR family NAD(P)-dependent oxidoreductase [Proteobacteria bacterium]|nr:SDR family NAD(P)-dependent oxidoreductase [Pseudomonadota bacterium]